MRIVWTQEALERLEDIQYYLAVKQSAPQAAQDMIDKLIGKLPQIEDMPFSGKELADHSHPNIRELLENPYRIIYYVDGDVIYLISIMHQRQLLPKVKEIRTMVREAIKLTDSEY